MKFNFTLFHWFNAIAQNTKLIGNDIVILNDKTSEYGIMADPNAHLEVGERVCAFNCNTGKSDDKLECVFEALRNNDGYTAVTIESRVEDSVNSMYIATFGSKNEYTLHGYYAKAYQGNNVLLRKQDLMRLLSAKSKMLTEKIKADERMIEKLLSLYYKLAGDTIGDKGYIPETVAAYDYRKGER